MIWIVLGVVGAIFLFFVVATVMTVDDWSRDLSTNVAETKIKASDPLLRPIFRKGSVTCARWVVEKEIAEMPRWTLGDVTEGDGEAVLHATRKTPLWGFVDDIRITIKPTNEEGVSVDVYSKSRLGKGDLGQNPRNIKELTRRLQEVDEAAWDCDEGGSPEEK
ncbi:DUF1499 domain-containing protein [Blastopirellula retiformator]|nr:DUF1499 domain-containing protein [Blastopirellula retiformator]